MEELTSITRDFARYVVEMTKPKSEWYKSSWVWIVVIIIFIILGALFLPQIIGVIGKSAGTAGAAFSGAGGGAVTPLG